MTDVEVPAGMTADAAGAQQPRVRFLMPLLSRPPAVHVGLALELCPRWSLTPVLWPGPDEQLALTNPREIETTNTDNQLTMWQDTIAPWYGSVCCSCLYSDSRCSLESRVAYSDMQQVWQKSPRLQPGLPPR